ncbi:Amino acid ABC transporter, glutamine-binding protein/permease protein [Clostridiaceae bacterium JG1575]|nr:Amino acid ABC transporter, glutamine-binding protein/permease protein [Clostridiaceae bacterium JG1575]
MSNLLARIHAYGWLFLEGIQTTLLLSFVGTLAGLFLGVFLAAFSAFTPSLGQPLAQRALGRAAKVIARAYVAFVRGTPMMVQAVFLYNLLYRSLHWQPFTAGLVIVSLNTSAYMAEILRSGIQSVSTGQREAALCLGMSEGQVFRWVVLPQALRKSFPALGNEWVINIKDTSVLNAIGVTELFFQGMSVAGNTYRFTESMLLVSCIYFVLTFAVTQGLHVVEEKLKQPVYGPGRESVKEEWACIK